MSSDHDVINTNISNATSSLSSLINAKGIVKSVQHGYVDGISMHANENSTFEIPISDINPDRSIQFINFHGDFCIDYIRDPSLTKNKLVIPFDHRNGSLQVTSGFDYQIVEFY